MIFVDRSTVYPPRDLSAASERLADQLGKIYESAASSHAQRRPDFKLPARISGAVRKELDRLFRGKCAYCERLGSATDHFRPIWRAGRLDGRIDAEHYWWLAAEWSNLYLCCHECNYRKANAFPIDGEPAHPRTFGQSLLSEKPLLVDPCEDQPEEHLRFTMTGEVVPLTRRGEVTVQMFELNNPKLVTERADCIKMAQRVCANLWAAEQAELTDPQEVRRRARAMLAPSNFQAAVRAAIDDFIRERFNIPDEPAPPPVNLTAQLERPKPVWLDAIEIRNFKSIDALDLAFPKLDAPREAGTPDDEPLELIGEVVGQPWLMVLGENGVGKSSLLQAVALALMPEAKRNAMGRPSSWLRQHDGVQVKSGHVRLTFSDGSVREIGFRKGVAAFTVRGDVPQMPVLAYGSVRLLPQRSSKPSEPEAVSVRNLFDHRYPLSSTEHYLCDEEAVPDELFQILAGSLKSLLPISEETELKRKPDHSPTHLSATVAGRTLTLSQLSDGYKSMLALAMDIMFHLTNNSFDMESARGLVLIDELELHLHPRWKVQIVGQLRALFPNVRFVVTTHEPLCVLGLRSKELHVITTDPLSGGVKQDPIDVPKGTRADEVLTGPWFGVASTIDADTQQLMDEHSKLLASIQRSPDEEARRLQLEELLRQRLGGFGTTRAERVAMAAVAVLNSGRRESHLDQVLQHRLARLLGGGAGTIGDGANA